MDLVARLRQFEILSHVSDDQIAQLARLTARREFAEGAELIAEGDSGYDAYLIDAGSVLIRRMTPYGLYALATLGTGDLFGETSYIDRKPRSTDAIAAESTALITLRPEILEPATGSDHRLHVAIYWAFWKSLSRKLRSANEKLAQFFDEGGQAAPGPEAPAAGDRTTDIGVRRKRDLFREQRLSPMEINFLSSLSSAERIEPGAVIFREGDDGDRMYVVLEGRVMISKRIPGAGEEALAFLEHGETFGEMALIDREPRSADAKAGDEGALLIAISRDVLEGILNIERVSSLPLLKLMCGLVAKRLREIDDKLMGWFVFASSSGDTVSS